MKKKIIIIGIIVLLIAGGITTFFVLKNNNKECNSQATRFKKLYEKYNSVNITYNKKKYKLQNLEIEKDNPMASISKEDIYNKLEKGTNIIFFSSPKDYTSREMLQVLLEVAKGNNCDTIYYFDIDKLNENYSKEIDVELYDKITGKLDSNINNYFKDTDKKKIENGTIVFSKDGEIKKVIENISDDYEYGNKITKKQEKSLKTDLNEGFSNISGGVCEIRQQC